MGGVSEPILRFDHLQPLGENAQAIEITPYRLTAEAAEIVEEWLDWFRKGELIEDGIVSYFRNAIGRA